MHKSLSLLLLVLLALCGACPADDDASNNDNDAGPQPRSPRFYASVAGDDEVLAFDDDTHEVLSTFKVGKGPAILLATPDRKKLYTANWGDNSVSSITLVNAKVASIELAGRPYVIATAPDGKYLYVGVQPDHIAVIDIATDEVVREIMTKELPASVIVSPDGETLYVATLGGTIRALSAADGSVIHEPIKVGTVPAWITMSPDGSKVFTLNFLSDDVSVVDTASWKVVKTIDTGAGTRGIIGTVTSDGNTLYVTNHGTGELIAIDTESYEISKTIALDGRPVGVACNSDDSRVYVADFGTKSLEQPLDQNYLLTGVLTVQGDGQLSVFDAKSGKMIGKKIETGRGPTSLVVLD